MKPILEYIISKTSKVINHITLEDFEKELREKCNDSNDDTLIKNIIEELKNQSKEYVEITCTLVNLLIKNGYKIILGLHEIEFSDENLKAVQIISVHDGYIIFAFINVKAPFIMSIGMGRNKINICKTKVKDKNEFISLLDKKEMSSHYDKIFETNKAFDNIKNELDDYKKTLYSIL
jgi:hypothetical protein